MKQLEKESTAVRDAAIHYCGCTANSHNETCGAKFQDSLNGRGRRLFTRGKKSRCTVCGKEYKS